VLNGNRLSSSPAGITGLPAAVPAWSGRLFQTSPTSSQRGEVSNSSNSSTVQMLREQPHSPLCLNHIVIDGHGDGCQHAYRFHNFTNAVIAHGVAIEHRCRQQQDRVSAAAAAGIATGISGETSSTPTEQSPRTCPRAGCQLWCRHRLQVQGNGASVRASQQQVPRNESSCCKGRGWHTGWRTSEHQLSLPNLADSRQARWHCFLV